MEASVNRKDIVWVDWAKFISMFFVYWCHIDMLCDTKFVFCPVPYGSFFVNTFFVVSGYLFFKKHLPKLNGSFVNPAKLVLSLGTGRGGVLPGIFYKIAIPTILFSLAFALPRYYIRGEAIEWSVLLFDTFFKGTCWFTCCLCVSELILFLLLVLIQSRSVWVYLLISIPISIWGNHLISEKTLLLGSEYAPWFYKNGMLAIYLMVCGGGLQQYEQCIDSITKRIQAICVNRIASVIVLIALLFFIYFFKPFHSSNYSVQFGFDLCGVVYCILSVLIVIMACKMCSYSGFVRYISRHTIGMYFLSAAFPFVWGKFIEAFFVSSSLSFVFGVIGSFLTSFAVVYCLDKYVPFVFDIRVLLNNSAV